MTDQRSETDILADARRVLEANGHTEEPIPGARSDTPDGWPKLADEALYGLPGDVVRAVDPHTEGDPAAVLVTFLLMMGSAIGSGPYVDVSDKRHGVNEFAALVGATSKGRKGTAHATPLRLVSTADPTWAGTRITGGLSSGEGVIWPIRDPIETTKKGETVIEDQGVTDKRLLVVQEELSQLFKQCQRQGNTLSEILRQAWDGNRLGVMTRNSPYRATSPHVSLIGHITRDELRRVVDETDLANGLCNRFLWVCVRRSKSLPEGGRLPDRDAAELALCIAQALKSARTAGEVTRDAEARALWADIYPDLSDGKPGLFGAVIGRAEAHVLRLSLLYALLDESQVIRAAHIVAALDVWDYCKASARYIFGDATGDPIADRILTTLRASGPMTQTEINDLFGRHQAGSRIARAVEMLAGLGIIHRERKETGGRPRTLWRAA